MCNTYRISHKRGAKGLAQQVNEAAAKMVTTGSSPLMAPIHDRMPALLRPEEMAEFLAGTGHWNFQPFNGPLAVTACESPLVKRKNPETPQELF